jgi:putative transposase
MGDEKLTVAVTPVNNESKVEHVKRLLSKVFELGIKVKILLLDSGYYTVDIINYLNAKGINFIMRAKGKFKDRDDLIYKTKSKRKRPDEQATFRIVAVKDRNELLVFATNTDLKPKSIRRMFGKRWAIETSYRMINQFLPKTTSKLYSLRKLYFYLAVLLYNIWVFMNYKREKITVQYVKFLLMIEALISNVYVKIFR